MSYSIQEVADMMKVKTSTLRYYDSEGNMTYDLLLLLALYKLK